MTKANNTGAVVVGSGPNGLAAAITLAKAGLPVTAYEKNDTIGGACRTAELIESGYRHDTGSAVHPMAAASPFFKGLPLKEQGLNWVEPPAALAHPFDDGTAVLLMKSLDETVATLDMVDRDAYRKLMQPLVNNWDILAEEILWFPRLFRHPFFMAGFGLNAISSATGLARRRFTGTRAAALMAGLGVHSVMPLEARGSAAPGLVLGAAAHAAGWPLPEGGSQSIADALASYLKEIGGTIVTGHEVTTLAEFPDGTMTMLDVTARQATAVTGKRLPLAYRDKLATYRYGPAVWKVDWVLDGPVPWMAEECFKAGTLHLGGTLEEIAAAEEAVFRGIPPEKPFVLLVQPTLFDRSRTNHGGEIVWAYCHVPVDADFDMTGRIEAQVERFAPGFKDRIIGRHVATPSMLEAENPNCVGGDITGGSQGLRRLLLPLVSHATPEPDIFFCSSTTPPGPGVHGMCGYRAARMALQRISAGYDKESTI